MPSAQDFEELYGVTEERALNFWVSHLHELLGTERWGQIRDSTGVYLASVLGHFCLQSTDRLAVLSPDPARAALRGQGRSADCPGPMLPVLGRSRCFGARPS